MLPPNNFRIAALDKLKGSPAPVPDDGQDGPEDPQDVESRLDDVEEKLDKICEMLGIPDTDPAEDANEPDANDPQDKNQEA